MSDQLIEPSVYKKHLSTSNPLIMLASVSYNIVFRRSRLCKIMLKKVKRRYFPGHSSSLYVLGLHTSKKFADSIQDASIFTLFYLT